MLKEFIQNNLLSNNKLIASRLSDEWFIKHHDISIKQEIYSLTRFFNENNYEASDSLRCRCILNNIQCIPKCICGSFVSNKSGKFTATCGNKECASKQSYITNIKNNNGKHNLFVSNTRNKALKNAQSIESKIKRSKTISEKWDGNYCNRSKMKETFSKRNNEDKLLSNQKRESYCLNVYGVKHTSELESVKNKNAETSKERYGSTHWSSSDVAKKHFKKRSVMEGRGFYWSKKEFVDEINKDNGNIIKAAQRLGIDNSILYSLAHRHGVHSEFIQCGRSTGEKDLENFIRSIYKGTIIIGNRSVLEGKELDIYLPELNIAFEYNGTYFHSEIFKDKNYHQEKTSQCKEVNISLYHVWEHDWIKKCDIWKSRIASIIGVCSTRLFARKCSIEHVSSSDKSVFMKNNHLQGNCPSQINLGLYYNNTLVSCMTFSKNKLGWILNRFATVKYSTVVGGFQKLLKHFVTNNSGDITSYADMTYSNGGVYAKAGFVEIRKSNAQYWYTKNFIDVFNRQSFMKNKMKSIKGFVFDSSLSESQNMKNNNFVKIYGSGVITYTLFQNNK